ncbi:MAG: M56 family metallopeptidase [Gemmatimonadales bacterium]|jgi:TonB family protein
MIAAWMLYAILVGTLLSAAALVLERAAALFGRGRRWVWATAIAGSIGLPLVTRLGVSPLGGAGEGARLLPAGAVRAVRFAFEPITTAGTAAGSPVPPLDAWIAGAWALASLVLLVWFLRGQLALARERRRWERAADESLAADTPVRLTDDFGPAVVGLHRGEIVLPRWCLELSPVERELVIAHETEHLRGGDVRLLLAGRLAVVALPWLLPLWWQLHRLRLAVELDCDGRVLRRGIDTSSYGRLLLEVGSRRSGRLPVVALAEPASHLERRIRAMIEAKPRHRWLHVSAAVAAGLAIVAVACESPVPTANEAVTADAAPAGTIVEKETPVARSAIAKWKYRAQEQLTGDQEMPFGEFREVPLDESAAKEWKYRVQEKLENAPRGAAGQIREAPAESQFGRRDVSYVPRDEQPVLLNREALVATMRAKAAEALGEGENGRTVGLYMFVDASGSVTETRVAAPSGSPDFDTAATQIARDARFEPAKADGEPVGVWIKLPFRFEAR